MDVVQAGPESVDSGFETKRTEIMAVDVVLAGSESVGSGFETKMTESTAMDVVSVGLENVDSGFETKMTENMAMDVVPAGLENVGSGFETKMTENTAMDVVPAGSESVGSGFDTKMTENTATDVVPAGSESVGSGFEKKMTENMAIDVVLAGPGNVDSGFETKMAECTPLTDTSEKIDGGVDTRCRRRSKYLSFPYTNSGLRHKDSPAETEESRTPCVAPKTETSTRTRKPSKKYPSSKTKNHSNESPLSAKLGAKRFRNTWYRKFLSCSSMSTNPNFINASPGELLSGLYSVAVDCMSSVGDKSFDLDEWFFCKHRISEYHDEAELATFMVNENGGKAAKPVGNGLMDTKSEKKRKYTKTENPAGRKTKPLSGLLDMNSNSDCTSPGKKRKQKRKVEEITSLHPLQNGETTINESGNKCSAVPETHQKHDLLASEKKARPKKKQKLDAAQKHQGAAFAPHLHGKSTEYSSLVIDLQHKLPTLTVDIHGKRNDENKREQVFRVSNPEMHVSQDKVDGNVTRTNLLPSAASEAGTASLGRYVGSITNHNLLGGMTSDVGIVSTGKTGLKNRMEKAPEEHPNTKHATELPDLNNISFESCSTRKESETVNFLSPELKSEHPRSLSACSRHTKTVNFDRLEANGESTGTFLFLQFAPGVEIPSKENLMISFCQFGPLKASETRLMKDNGSAQIVFAKDTDAAEAFRNLEQNKPFGEALVGYRLHHPPVAAPSSEQFMTPNQPTRPMSMPGEITPLQFIKQNLQMMTSVLENSGSNLSPQMRAKLESEIKNLLNKVNSRDKA